VSFYRQDAWCPHCERWLRGAAEWQLKAFGEGRDRVLLLAHRECGQPTEMRERVT
jgi:hypothetical protein